MKLRALFIINIFLSAFFGLICVLLPRLALQLYGLSANAAAIWVFRLGEGSILGYNTLMWFGRITIEGRFNELKAPES